MYVLYKYIIIDLYKSSKYQEYSRKSATAYMEDVLVNRPRESRNEDQYTYSILDGVR